MDNQIEQRIDQRMDARIDQRMDDRIKKRMEQYDESVIINKKLNEITLKMLEINDDFLKMNENCEKYTDFLKILSKVNLNILQNKPP